MKKIGIIGRFAFGENLLNGQTVKTKSLTTALLDNFGEDELICFDTYGGIKALLRLPFQCMQALGQCSNLIIMPAHKGIRIIAPLLMFMNLFYKRTLHYVVIGAWLCDLIKNKPILKWCLKRFDHIYAETQSMKRKLESLGFQNIVLMPNFKELDILREEELARTEGQVCRLCTFSRVMKEKGIGIAVEAVQSVNAKLEKTAYTLDIYGQVDIKQTQWFEDLKNSFTPAVQYCGEIPYEQSVSVLKNYDLLLFPTQFYTEGIPGTIIDAYAAGLPVIASMWENYGDIIDSTTGFVYPFGDPMGLEKIMLQLAKDTSPIRSMRRNCLHNAQLYTPERVIRILIDKLVN